MNVKPLFKLMVEKKASDLFFTPFAPAKIKIDGKIMPVNKLEMTPKMVKQAAIELMTEDLLDTFTKELEVDFAISEPGLGRFRVNVFHQRGNVAMVLRYITSEMPTLDELGMPEQRVSSLERAVNRESARSRARYEVLCTSAQERHASSSGRHPDW
jgi:twitching motility protein PilU